MKSSSQFISTDEARLLRKVASFRYQLRRFLWFSERAARSHGVTPLQHQMLLGVAGFTGRGWASISELAEFLQERHNAVVSLVGRAARRELIGKVQDTVDRRIVRVVLTRKGAMILRSLTRLHQGELGKLRPSLGKMSGISLAAGTAAKKKQSRSRRNAH